MCVDPVHMTVDISGVPTRVKMPCRDCWQCRRRTVNDYVGRCLCEAAVSDWTYCATFTYRDCRERDEDGAHRVILPRHWQLFAKQFRNSGHKFRYFVVGEYGGEGGRAHFHAMLFGQGASPQWRQGWNYPDEWPHGHVDVDAKPDERAIRYTTKYLLKAERAKRWFSLSKKPVLGWGYIERMARRDAALRVLPTDFSYCPPGADLGRRFYLVGTARRDYLRVWEAECGLLGDSWFTASVPARGAIEKLSRWEAERMAVPETAAEFDADFAKRLAEWRKPSAACSHWLDECDDWRTEWHP